MSPAAPVVPAKLTCPLAKAPPVKTGFGAVVSSVKVRELVPVAPPALVSLATMVWLPLARPVGVNAHAPDELAVAVAATAAPSTVKWTIAPASAVPLSAALEVILSVADAPVSLAKAAVTKGAVDEGGG